MKSVHNYIVTAVTAVSLLTGCAAMNNNVQAQAVPLRSNILSVQYTVGLGETMVKQGLSAEASNIKSNRELALSFIYGCYFFGECNGKYEEYKKSELFGYEETHKIGNNKIAMLSDPYSGMKAFKNGRDICIVAQSGKKVCKNYNDFDRFIRNEIKLNSSQQSLIFKGRVGNNVKIEYVEFSNSREQPAIINELECNLEDTNIITHKGAAIEILAATTETIRYKVVSNFSRVK